jgi:hypothetical protein
MRKMSKSAFQLSSSKILALASDRTDRIVLGDFRSKAMSIKNQGSMASKELWWKPRHQGLNGRTES